MICYTSMSNGKPHGFLFDPGRVKVVFSLIILYY